MRLCSIQNYCWLYIGKDGLVIVTPAFNAIMLRLSKDHIAAALFSEGKVVSVADGRDGASAALLNIAGNIHVNDAEKQAELHALAKRFADCMIEMTSDGALVTFDGQDFMMSLAENVDLDDLRKPEPIQDTLPIAERMRRWNRGLYYGWNDQNFRAWVSNGRYDFNWAMNLSENFIYCRLGVSGYCDRGWAMRSTAVLRANEVRMLPDHRGALRVYRPVEECFVPDGCAFPDDGGWYWSIREVTQDAITLNGCGGDTYVIYRPR